MEIIGSLLIWVLPLLVVPYVFRDRPSTRAFAIFTFFVAPLVGLMTLLAVRGGPRSITTGGYWDDVAGFYFFAVIPLGFWAAAFAAAGVSVVATVRAAYSLRPLVLAVPTSIFGALVGAAFLAVVGRGTLDFIVSGAASGALCGAACPYFIRFDRRAAQQHAAGDAGQAC